MHYIQQPKPFCLNILKKFVGKLYALFLAFEVKAKSQSQSASEPGYFHTYHVNMHASFTRLVFFVDLKHMVLVFQLMLVYLACTKFLFGFFYSVLLSSKKPLFYSQKRQYFLVIYFRVMSFLLLFPSLKIRQYKISNLPGYLYTSSF